MLSVVWRAAEFKINNSTSKEGFKVEVDQKRYKRVKISILKKKFRSTPT